MIFTARNIKLTGLTALKALSFFIIGKIIIKTFGVEEFVIFNQLAQLSFFLIPFLTLFLQLTLSKSISGELNITFSRLLTIQILFISILSLLFLFYPKYFIYLFHSLTGLPNYIFENHVILVVFLISIGFYGILTSIATGITDIDKLLNFEIIYFVGMLLISFIGIYFDTIFLLRFASFFGFVVVMFFQIKYFVKSRMTITDTRGIKSPIPYILSSLLVAFSVPITQIILRGILFKFNPNDAATFIMVQKFSGALVIPIILFVSQVENPKFFNPDFSRKYNEWLNVVIKTCLLGIGLLMFSLFFIGYLSKFFSEGKVSLNIWHYILFSIAEVFRISASLFSYYYSSKGKLFLFFVLETVYLTAGLFLIYFFSENIKLYYLFYCLLGIFLLIINLIIIKKNDENM